MLIKLEQIQSSNVFAEKDSGYEVTPDFIAEDSNEAVELIIEGSWMKGLIIAAGRVSRLGHLTKHSPKPLVKVGNSCFLENTILHLESLGADNSLVDFGW